MVEWTPHRAFALFLGLWIALAPAVFAVPAAAMALEAGMTGDTDSGGCDGCPGTDADTCALICFNAGLVAIPPAPGCLATALHVGDLPVRHPVLAGRVSIPDPAPPKPVSHL